MSSDATELVFIAMTICVSVGLLVGIVALVVWLQKRNADRWAATGAALGLEQSGPSGWFKRPELTGRRGAHAVRLYTYVVSTGKSSQTYTVAIVLFERALGLGLKVYKEGLLSKLGKAVGTQDIETGDAVFDDQVMIKGNDAPAVVGYLTAERRAAIAALLRQHTAMQVVDTGLTITLGGWVTDEGKLRPLLDAMERTAVALEGGDATRTEPAGGFGSEPPPSSPPGGFRITELPGS